MASDRRRALAEALLRSPRALSGEELASALGVSSRTVRTYVGQLNARGTVVVASHHGYTIDSDAYHRLLGGPERTSTFDTPDRRLRYLCRKLAQATEPLSVYDLAGEVFVSDSTLEADLSRAREVLREHDLRLRRDHDLVRVEGAERSRRRLVRQMLYRSTEGLIPSTWQAFSAEYAHVDVQLLRERVATIVAASDLELNEFALSDVLLHLTIAIDRASSGHTLPPQPFRPATVDAAVEALCGRLAAEVDDLLGLRLSEPEMWALYGMIVVRAVRQARPGTAEAVVDPALRGLVAELLEDLSAKYLLGPADASVQLNLSLHVQNLLARATSGLQLSHPLGEGFKNKHPLVHDLALDFAERLEARAGVSVSPAEVDYLTLHMGLQYMRYLEQRDLVTITLVAPHYYTVADVLAETLTRAVRGQAVVERVATTLDFDFGAVTSDLIVSCVDPPGPTSAPLVRIPVFPSPPDLDQVVAAVRLERDRNIRRRIRTTLTTLIDPALFVRLPSAVSREDALALLCERMLRAGYVEEGFLADVLDRESRSSTAFGGEFAIPHSMHMDAPATAISVMVADQPIPWGSSLVRLVFLFALSPDGRQTFRDVLDELTRLLSDGGQTRELIEAGTDADHFMAALVGLLDRPAS